MIQPVYSNEQLSQIAKDSYNNLVRFCEVLEQEGYWNEPESFLHRSIYEILDMYIQAVLLNMCIYCGENNSAKRGFMLGVVSENVLQFPQEGDISEEQLLAAKKLLRTPPIILQLCGLRDNKENTFFSSYFLDSLLNIMVACSLYDGTQSKFADKFMIEIYEKITFFVNEDQRNYVVNGRFIFLKLSTERFYDEKAPVQALKDHREQEELQKKREMEEHQRMLDLEKQKEEAEEALKKQLELERKAEEQRKKELEEEQRRKEEEEQDRKEREKQEEQRRIEQEEQIRKEREEQEEQRRIEREKQEEQARKEQIQKEQEQKKKSVFDYSDEELKQLQQMGKLKIKTPHIDRIKKEREAAMQRIQEERVAQIKEEINKINHAKQLQALLDELKGLVGLREVKTEIQSLINLIKVKKMRESYHMPTMDVSYHMVFTGNPGTGKTTVARLVAQIYKELGILSQGHLVEVDRAGLVAGYVGQTAIKVKEVVEKSLGGVLFIDEAYALSNKNDANDFGSEAIDTLVKMMEDHRDDLVIIVAGYKEEMDEFLKTNTGLISRFNKFINFEDYTNEELMQILSLFAEKAGLEIAEDALTDVRCSLEQMDEEKKFLFGNGRGMRNTFESILGKQADRVVQLELPTEEDLKRIILEDVIGIIA